MAIDINELKKELIGKTVTRPGGTGAISGHRAGEPFDEYVYEILKSEYDKNIYRHYEYLNNLYMNNLEKTSVEDRMNLIQNNVLKFLLNRGKKAVEEWGPNPLRYLGTYIGSKLRETDKLIKETKRNKTN